MNISNSQLENNGKKMNRMSFNLSSVAPTQFCFFSLQAGFYLGDIFGRFCFNIPVLLVAYDVASNFSVSESSSI